MAEIRPGSRAEPAPDSVAHRRPAGNPHRAALKQLPPDQAEVIRLSYFADQPHSEIALSLKLPLGTVKSRVRLAMMRLRQLLDEPS